MQPSVNSGGTLLTTQFCLRSLRNSCRCLLSQEVVIYKGMKKQCLLYNLSCKQVCNCWNKSGGVKKSKPNQLQGTPWPLGQLKCSKKVKFQVILKHKKVCVVYHQLGWRSEDDAKIELIKACPFSVCNTWHYQVSEGKECFIDNNQ